MDESNEQFGFFCLKIRMINPSIPGDKLEQMIYEKMEPFHQFTVKIVFFENVGRSAYLNFTHKEDAEAAFEKYKSIELFGDKYEIVAITKKPLRRGDPDDLRSKRRSPNASSSKYDTASDDVCETPVRSERAGMPDADGFQLQHRGSFRSRRPSRSTYPIWSHRHTLSLNEDRESAHTESVYSDMKEVADHEPNRNLYVGYLDPDITDSELREIFSRYGIVQNVEIKNRGVLNFAFIRFFNLYMARTAKQLMIGRYIGNSKPRFGYGAITPTKCVWVGDIGPWTTVERLRSVFSAFGEVDRVVWPDNRNYAYVEYTVVYDAQQALKAMNGVLHGEKRLVLDMVDVGLIDSKLNCDIRTQVESGSRYQRSVGKFGRRSRSPQGYRHRRGARGSRSRWPPSRLKSKSAGRRESKHNNDSGSSDRNSLSDPDSRNSLSPRRKRVTRSRSARSRSGSVHKKKRRRSSTTKVQSPMKSTSGKSDLTQPRDERTVVLKRPEDSIPSVSGYGLASIQSHYMPMPMYPTHTEPPPIHIYPPVLANPTYPPPPLPATDFFGSPSCPPPMYGAPYVPPSVQRFAPISAVQPPYYQHDRQPEQHLSHLYGELPPPSNAGHKARDAKVINFPKVWSGALVLKNGAFVINLHLVSGSVVLVNSLLGGSSPGASADCPVLKIAQRLRLDQPEKLDELDRRLKQAGRGACSVLLATSAEAEVDDVSNVIQQRPLQSLVTYLSQKEVAAVVPLPSTCTATTKSTGLLHAFPPCPFARKFLQREAPGIDADCPAEDQLLVVVCESS